MIETSQIFNTPAQLVATIHIEIPRSEMQYVMGPAIRELMAVAKAQGIGPIGPWFAHHHKMTPEMFNFNICVPVSARVNPIGRVTSWQRPAIKVLRTFYNGPYEGLGNAWHAFSEWAASHHFKTANDLYECYLVGPESSPDPSDWRTELIRPIID